jgi:methylated-DNA-protein-cysteine methyltransferase-like protein
VVARIPRGRVATYGEVAALAGKPGAGRHVGFALAALRGAAHRLPWQRVLGKRPGGWAGISLLDPMGAAVQRHLLEREGVAFDARGRVSLERFAWRPRRRRAPSRNSPLPRRGQVERASPSPPGGRGAGAASPPAPGRRPRSPRRTAGSSGRS